MFLAFVSIYLALGIVASAYKPQFYKNSNSPSGNQGENNGVGSSNQTFTIPHHKVNRLACTACRKCRVKVCIYSEPL